jgi:hypothetical protein
LPPTEAALYPSARELLGSDVDLLIERDRALSAAVDRLVRAPEARFDGALLDELEQVLADHVEAEETEVVPELQRALQRTGMGTLARGYSDAKDAYSGLVIEPAVNTSTTEPPTSAS